MELVLAFFGAWYNGVFVVPLLGGAIFITLQVTLGLLESGGDHDVDSGHDVVGGPNAGAGGHGAMGEGHGAGGLEGHGAGMLEAHHHALHGDVHVLTPDETGVGLPAKTGLADFLAGLLGLGKVPLSVLLETFAMTWGILGLALNWGAVGIAGVTHPGVLILTMPAAFLGAVLATRFIASLVHRLVPSVSTTSIKSHGFVGQVGTVTSARLTKAIGEIKITGLGQTSTWIVVRLEPDSPLDEVPAGEEVVVTHFDATANLFLVAPANRRTDR